MALVGLKEAADLAGTSVKTLRRAIQSGKLPASTVNTDRGTAYRVDTDLVQAMFKTGDPKVRMAANPLDGVKDELARLAAMVEAQSATIKSLEAELHDTKGQLSHQIELLRALPAPKKSWWPWPSKK